MVSTACHLPRPRLSAPLDGATPVVLVSGPAGSGKSALLDEWCGRRQDPRLCRVVLEDEETLFWQPVLRSLDEHGLPVRTLRRRLGRQALLGDRLRRELEAVLAASDRSWTLVVDGYELTAPALATEIEALLTHSAADLRLVLSPRLDPALPLHRRRLDGSLAEVRAADLAFTDEEASDLLALCGAPLPDPEVRTLNRRMGGWAAGLRFAAAAAARRPEAVTVLSTVASVDLDITEFLVHEVLDGLEPDVRDLLLRTCVPDVLTPELVEDLVGPDALSRLARLERANLFLEQGEDGSLRHHPFFRDLLRAQLAHEDPTTAARRHRRVAEWLRAHEEWDRAALQLAAGRLWADLAQQLVDDVLVTRLLVGEEDPLQAAARRIPPEVTTPAADVVRAALALTSGEDAQCARFLGRARETGDRFGPESVPRGLSYAVVAAAHAASSESLDVAETAVRHAGRVLATSRFPAARLTSPELEGLLQVAAARVALRRGELGSALASLARVESLPGLPTRLRVGVLGHRALALALGGRLTQARDDACAALAVADDAHLPDAWRAPASYAALALVALERDDPMSARQHLGHARTCRSIVNDPVSRAVGAGVLAHLEARTGAYRVPAGEGDADDLWEEVDDPWLVRWLRLQQAEAAVAHGRPEQGLAVLQALPEGPGPAAGTVTALAYAELGRPVALARTLAQEREDAASPVTRVGRLLVAAVHEADRHGMAAAAPVVEAALEAASHEEVRRPFRAAPPSVHRVLAAHRELLEGASWLQGTRPVRAPAPPPHVGGSVTRPFPAHRSAGPALPLEPLTPKELEVLTHLSDLLSTEEIADRMSVSVNTVRTHVRNILRKLDTHRRNGAVRRARELGLLDGAAAAATLTPWG